MAIPRGAEEGEIWYLIHPEGWGRGIATAATKQLLKLGFEELGLHRMWASCLPENPASGRVLEKLGWKNSFLFAILAEEWHGRSGGRDANVGASGV